MNLRTQKATTETGFTLIEALVSITILLVAIVAPMEIAYRSVAQTAYAKNLLVAQYLARDAAEYLTAKIRNNEALGNDWLDTISNACVTSVAGEDKLCTVDTVDDDVELCNIGTSSNDQSCGAAVKRLRYNSTTGKYSHTSGDYTNFRRLASIVEDGDELRIAIAVSWGTSLYASGDLSSTIDDLSLSNTSSGTSGSSYILRFNIYKGN